MAGFRLEFDRERFFLSHLYTRRILSNYLGIHPRAVSLSVNPNGKPVVAAGATSGGRNFGFNLAHCETHAVVAVAPTEMVGVDIEQRRPGIDAIDISKRYFAREEYEELNALLPGEIHTRFLRLWTCKEAFVKAIGLGLSYPLDRFVVCGLGCAKPEYKSLEPQYGPPSAWSLRTYVLAPDRYVALAAKISQAEVRVFADSPCKTCV